MFTSLLLVCTLTVPNYQAAVESLSNQEHWYGLYMKNQRADWIKVGWMKLSSQKEEKQTTFTTDMKVRVRGLGQTAEMSVYEKRTFNNKNGALHTLLFFQDANNMALRIQAQSQNGTLTGTIHTGGMEQPLQVPCKETILDHLAAELMVLANRPKKGQTKTVTRFDPSLMRNMTVTMTMEDIQQAFIDGISTHRYYISSKTIEPPMTNINSQSVFDSSGLILHTTISGIFSAKLEPKEKAKDIAIQPDILLSSVVTLPKKISPTLLRKPYTITFDGFPKEFQLQTSDGILFSRNENELTLTIKANQAPKQTIPLYSLKKKITPSIQAYILETPQYQISNAEIKRTAKQVIGTTTDSWQATKKLVNFVSTTLEKSYVAAMPNAVDVLKQKQGDCTEHSTLFVALARSLGIPARQAVGIAYWPTGKGFGWHAWAEVWIGEWVQVDPTWNQNLADTTHIKLAAGSLEQQVKIAGLLGILKIKSIQPL